MLNDADLPVDKINECMGDPEADVENKVLKVEQEMQVTIMFFTLLFFKQPLYFIIANNPGVSNTDILYCFSINNC